MVVFHVLADLVVVVHAAYVGFVVLGFAAILIGAALNWGWVRNAWFRAIHLLAIVLVSCEALAGVTCPLTVLEDELRIRGGGAPYPGAFIGYWAHQLIFYNFPPWVFTVIYVVFALIVAASIYLVPPRWPRREARSARARA